MVGEYVESVLKDLDEERIILREKRQDYYS